MISDHSRPVGYPKLWLIVRESLQKWPKLSGLRIVVNCLEILMCQVIDFRCHLWMLQVDTEMIEQNLV